jgi:hypothetical protein
MDLGKHVDNLQNYDKGDTGISRSLSSCFDTGDFLKRLSLHSDFSISVL